MWKLRLLLFNSLCLFDSLEYHPSLGCNLCSNFPRYIVFWLFTISWSVPYISSEVFGYAQVCSTSLVTLHFDYLQLHGAYIQRSSVTHKALRKAAVQSLCHYFDFFILRVNQDPELQTITKFRKVHRKSCHPSLQRSLAPYVACAWPTKRSRACCYMLLYCYCLISKWNYLQKCY